MKKNLLLFVVMCMASLKIYAQGIQFEHGTWMDILKKASVENKIIFVDVYTTWCGPCKKVSETVFPQERLGEYYNSHFINFKVDAESEFGKEFVKKYPVDAYPTFFFIDYHGNVVNKTVGAKDVSGFLQEAKLVDMYSRYGGIENFMKAIQSGTADKEMLYDYYQSANEKKKPEALNFYLKSLSLEELMEVDAKLIDDLSLYDKDLLKRFADGIIHMSQSEKFADKKFVAKFVFDVAFPIQYDISTYLLQAINDGNKQWFSELLELKEYFKNYKGRLFDGDLNIIRGRGLFFATSDYVKLCYWAKNRTNEEEFVTKMTHYMGKLINDYPIDSLLKVEENALLLKVLQGDTTGVLRPFRQSFFEKGYITALNILSWTDYFWKLSPSDKKTRTLCTEWIHYAFYMNPYNSKIALPAADLLARIGNMKEAITLLEDALVFQEEIHTHDKKTLRNLNLKLADLKNGKI